MKNNVGNVSTKAVIVSCVENVGVRIVVTGVVIGCFVVVCIKVSVNAWICVVGHLVFIQIASKSVEVVILILVSCYLYFRYS